MRVGRANGEDWLRLGEAAGALGVSLNTVRRWSDSGNLTCYRSPGGHRRYRRSDVESLLRLEDVGPSAPATPTSPSDRSGVPDFDALRAPLGALARVATDGVGAAACRISLAAPGGRHWVLAVPGWPAGDPATAGSGSDASPAVGEVLRTGRRLVIADLETTSLLSRDEAAAHRARGDQALLAVPMALHGRLGGVLELVETRLPRSFSGANVAFAEFMARQAERVISGDDDSTSLHREVTQIAEPIAGFSAPATASDAETLVRAALRTLQEQAGVAACALYRLENGIATPFASDGGAPVDGGAPWRLDEYPPAAAAAASGSAVIAGQDQDGLLEPEAAARFLEARGLAGAVLAPLLFWGELVGILELGTSDPAGLPAAAQVARVTADLLAVTLGSGDVVKRLQRRNRDLALVIAAGLEDTARLSTDEVLHAVAQRISELTHSPVADIYAVEGDTLRALVSYDGGRFDTEWEGVVMPLPRYPCSRRAVETGEIAIAASLEDPILAGDGRYSLEKWGYQSQLSLPLVSGGRVIGLVELSDYQPRDFAADLDLIRGLGQVAAHALENAALFEQVERRSRILNELVELGALTSSTRELDTLLKRVAERLLGAVDAANCDIHRMSDDGLRCVACFDRSGHDPDAIGTLLDPARYPTLVAAMNGHQVLIITSPDDPQLSEAERRMYRDHGFASEVSIPLVVNDELYGLLDIYDTRERDYGEYLSFLRSAGQTLAGAFESALLFDQLERRSSVLRDIVELGAVASQAHDLNEVLTALAERLRDTIGAADCDIFTLQGDKLRCLVSADRDGIDAGVVGHVLDIDKFPATAMAVHSGQAVAVASLDDPRLTDDERADMGKYGYQSELCIPLLGGERVIGLIDVFDTRPRDYAEYSDYLRSVGQTAAGAIENALLLDELKHRNAALTELVDLGEAVSGAGGLTQLVRSVGPRLVARMEAHGCQVFILRGDTLYCVLTYDNGEFFDDYADRPLDLSLFPSTREAIEQRTALVIESPDDPRLSDYERDLYADSGSRSKICVPLVLNDRVVGLLGVYDHRRRDYAEHSDFLLRVGQIMAGAFE